ncbi:hypothetical protein [Pseudomonas aeruginosa]|uniref:hypothetical protein n=1 Tax=Pseudomonas aeruginosa TaxID=287 RepID=UPI00157BA8CD|nr:hypothetical protein [Pseudomonas aeruginosa]HBO2482232.1 hypothetical protein [Pseudomonas aeruginosa]HCK7445017.1 hypothetical protein [Pseudomonas aeruginosa]HEP9018808.1 hypothetical protein [Pseudomonas aeruginosa]
MIDLKKVSGLKTSKPAHNIEDARVIADKKRKKIPAWIKKTSMFLIRNGFMYICTYVLENREELLSKLLEIIL